MMINERSNVAQSWLYSHIISTNLYHFIEFEVEFEYSIENVQSTRHNGIFTRKSTSQFTITSILLYLVFISTEARIYQNEKRVTMILFALLWTWIEGKTSDLNVSFHNFKYHATIQRNHA